MTATTSDFGARVFVGGVLVGVIHEWSIQTPSAPPPLDDSPFDIIPGSFQCPLVLPNRPDSTRADFDMRRIDPDEPVRVGDFEFAEVDLDGDRHRALAPVSPLTWAITRRHADLRTAVYRKIRFTGGARIFRYLDAGESLRDLDQWTSYTSNDSRWRQVRAAVDCRVPDAYPFRFRRPLDLEGHAQPEAVEDPYVRASLLQQELGLDDPTSDD